MFDEDSLMRNVNVMNGNTWISTFRLIGYLLFPLNNYLLYCLYLDLDYLLIGLFDLHPEQLHFYYCYNNHPNDNCTPPCCCWFVPLSLVSVSYVSQTRLVKFLEIEKLFRKLPKKYINKWPIKYSVKFI